jgi:hypothetical protein
MAFEYATGVLTVGTGALGTNYSVTGLSFQPKAVRFWWSGRADASDAAGEVDIQPGIGAAVSSTARWVVASQCDHSPTTTATDRYHSEAACVAVLDIAGAVVGLADFVSMNSDGFTLVIDDVFPAAVRVSWEAFGGSDLTDTAVGAFQIGSSTGDIDFTSETSFQPDFAYFAGIALPTNPPVAAGSARLSIGAATAADQAVLAWFSNDASGTSISSSYCRAGEIHAACATNNTTIAVRASLTSFLSTGFRINILEGAINSWLFYLALKGGSYKIGNFLTATNTTAFTEAHGMSGTPKGAAFFSANRAASTSDAATAHASFSLGAADASGQNCQFVQDKDASANADCFSAISHDQCYLNASVDAAMALEGEGHVNSFDSTNINLQMTDADPVQSFVWYAAFGNVPILTGDGAAAGTSTATGVGKSTWKAAGSASGTSTVAADGQSTNKAAGSASATSTVTAVGQSVKAGDGAAAGTSTATATGKSTWKAAGSAAGAATVTADAQSTNKAAGAASAAATVTADGQSTNKAAGSAAGTSTVEAVGQDANADAVGTASGTSTAAAIARAFALAGGSSQSISTAAAIAQAINMAVASAASTSTAEAVGEDAAGAPGLNDGDEVMVIQAGGIECSVYHDNGTLVSVVTASATQISVVQAGGTPIRVTI